MIKKYHGVVNLIFHILIAFIAFPVLLFSQKEKKTKAPKDKSSNKFTTTALQKMAGLENVRQKGGAIFDIFPNMVQIPGGTYEVGKNDINYRGKTREVTISSFWMNETEVTNGQYRMFVEWVRDSLAARDLGYIFVNPGGDTIIDWNRAKKIPYGDPVTMAKLTSIIVDPDKRLSSKIEIDPNKLVYAVNGFDYEMAARKENAGRSARDFIYHYVQNIYPDTLVWMRDFQYSFNQPMSQLYFSHPTYKNYPVVGVSWKQANAYCDWLSHQLNALRVLRGDAPDAQFRLPTETEWEYAAWAGGDTTIYGLPNNNMKPKKETKKKPPKRKKGDTTTVAEVQPAPESTIPNFTFSKKSLFCQLVGSSGYNAFGLYDMDGNVAEWTSSSYYEGGQSFANKVNPDIHWNSFDSDPEYMKRKVVKGLSWKDTNFKFSPSLRVSEVQDESNSFTGFRTVINLTSDYIQGQKVKLKK
ncbi:MAG: formylglycine-generating enzyme family protein [Chitinophagaceae bacterium]|nr:formylglycine-generating enzyme family protein [Chitinophagaceae bacterium]